MSYLVEGLSKGVSLLVGRDPETYSAIWATVATSNLAILASVCLGAPLGFLMGYCRFPGRKYVRLGMDTLLSFPTVVIGLLVYMLLSRRGPLGDWELLYTLPAVSLGQTLLGLPVIATFMATAVETADRGLDSALRTLGATPGQALLTTLWETRFSLAMAAAAAYGRIVSEVGIAMIVGGNIKWHTRTITTAIALETGKGEFATGIALGLVLMVVALLVNIAVAALRRRAG
jgi:tungstate transport system permease protein